MKTIFIIVVWLIVISKTYSVFIRYDFPFPNTGTVLMVIVYSLVLDVIVKIIQNGEKDESGS